MGFSSHLKPIGGGVEPELTPIQPSVGTIGAKPRCVEPGSQGRDTWPSDRSQRLTFAPTSSAIAASVVCAALSPSRKSLSE
jgi:hypothetical protein